MTAYDILWTIGDMSRWCCAAALLALSLCLLVEWIEGGLR